MSAKKDDVIKAVDPNAVDNKKRMEGLALAIGDEMESLTQKELERLYVAYRYEEKKSLNLVT